MPTFICDKCGAVENTATSDYWIDKMENRPTVCSKCATGKWHGKFERRHWSYYGLETVLQEQKQGNGNFINAREHLRNVGVIGSKKNITPEIPWE